MMLRKLLTFMLVGVLSGVAHGQMVINSYTYAISGGGGSDVDADAFIAAAGITDPTQQGAIQALVIDLKSAGIWAKCTGIYPFVGGSSTSHAVNLKSPGTYDLIFVGSPTHDGGGVDWNGTSQYATTGITVGVAGTVNSFHMSYYSRDNTTYDATSTLMGALDNNSQYVTLGARGSGLLFTECFTPTALASAPNGGASTVAFYSMSRQSASVLKLYKNGSSVATNASSPGTMPTQAININGYSVAPAGASQRMDNKQCAFSSIGSGLSDGEMSSLNTIVQAYQTALGR